MNRWLALLLCLIAGPAFAHQQGSSYSQWQLPAQVGEQPQVSVRISQLDLTRIGLHADYTEDFTQQAIMYLQQHLRLLHNQQPCVPQAAAVQLAQPGWLALRWAFSCASAQPPTWQIEADILFAKAPGHLHFARWQQMDAVIDKLLTAGDNHWQITPQQAEQSTGLRHYLALGVQHILAGWDHLAFVLGLLLLATTWRQLAGLITGFTVGHSMTLGLATVGWLQPNIVLIEAVIAWSIALLAAEVLWQRQMAWRWCVLSLLLLLVAWRGLPGLLIAGLMLFSTAYFVALRLQPQRSTVVRAGVTVVFGLIHGCGFAAILAELDLTVQQLWPALFGFNLGVEVGQLLVVAVLWPVLLWLTKRWSALPSMVALGLLGVASFWWILRV